jgi:predicted site-specific integrase-resolvase
MALDLPTYIPLEKAAEQFNLAVETLRKNVEEGKVRAAKTPAGSMLVAGEDVGELKNELSNLAIDRNLQGKPIRITEAAEKYRTSHTNLGNWAEHGYIRVLERGPKKLLLDEGDVKLVVEIFKRAKNETGSSVRAGWILKRIIANLKRS